MIPSVSLLTGQILVILVLAITRRYKQILAELLGNFQFVMGLDKEPNIR